MYCYFCHGYSGDAKTVASGYLQPPPRDFTRTALTALSAQDMITAVSQGRPGTAMMSFAAQLSEQQIRDVVYFVRRAFMAGGDGNTRYHTRENGWQDHQRYAAAFPFVSGELAIDTPAESLDEEQRRGLRLFMGSCITCHEGRSAHDAGTRFEGSVVSYPRAGYSNREPPDTAAEPDATTAATPYARHERPPEIAALDERERRGERLFQQNCAYCHGADGSGRNWIGTFLEPHPRDLGDPAFMQRMSAATLRQRIRDGLPGTTMPAWRGVLGDEEIDAIVSYLQRLAGTGAGDQSRLRKSSDAELTQ